MPRRDRDDDATSQEEPPPEDGDPGGAAGVALRRCRRGQGGAGRGENEGNTGVATLWLCQQFIGDLMVIFYGIL